MGDEVKLSVIKKTQDTLGKFVKRPPLTEKLLRKPPFRFLHDIITTVVRETKFLDGIFTDEEMNSENVKDKDSKIAFLQKVIDVVNIACGVSLTVRPTKIVAGYEPDKTNELLQAIGKAIEKKVDCSEAVKIVLSKSKESHGTENTNLVKSQTKKEDPTKVKKAPQVVKKAAKDQVGSNGLKQNSTKPAPKAEVKEKRSTLTSRVAKDKKTKKIDEKPLTLARDVKEETKLKVQVLKEKKKAGDAVGAKESSRKGGSEGKELGGGVGGRVEVGVEERVSDTRGNDRYMKGEEGLRKGSLTLREEEGDDQMIKRTALEVGDEMEDGFLSLEQPVSEREAGQRVTSAKNSIENAPIIEDNDTSGSTKKRHSLSGVRSGDVRASVTSGQRMAISTPVLRPVSVMAAAPSRPRSSRPHAPRLRSALGGLIPASDMDKAIDKTGKEGVVEQLIEGHLGGGGDYAEDVDEKEFLVEEARAPFPSTPAKEVKQQVGEGSEMWGAEGEKHQGVLVAKILETKKELEAGVEEGEATEGNEQRPLKRVEIEYEEDEMRRRRRGTGEMENLQSLVQSIARAAHPLGSLLGMVQENVETMWSETAKWRTECENLLKLLREEEKQMEVELEPLSSVLSELEQRVIEEREAVSAAKVHVLKAEQRIQVMLDPQGNALTQGIPVSLYVS